MPRMGVGSDVEASRLRALLEDLAALADIAGAWLQQAGTREVATTLADALVGLLDLDFAFVRLSDPRGAQGQEVTRGKAGKRLQERLAQPLTRRELVADATARGLVLPLGRGGEAGALVVASRRAGFPSATDELLLSVAAGQVSTAFEGARRTPVDAGTAEAATELERLAAEQAALRRVATLVAKEGPPAEVFAKVVEEVATVLGGVECSLFRDEGDGTVTRVALHGVGLAARGDHGRRFPVDGDGVIATVLRDGVPHRLDDLSRATGEIVKAGRDELGVRSAVGCPIVVRGRVWGAMGAARYEPHGFPPETETRMTRFAELAATAIANAQARAEVITLADLQSALRRVAILVAEGAAPTAVFDAVASETAALLDADGVTLCRYEPGGELTIVAHRGPRAELLAPGTRVGRDALAGGVSAPIVVDGGLWGAMIATWAGDEPPPPSTEERLAQFAELIDIAIANAHSREALAASRARLVTEADQARRRVVRDLHDGAQQRMVHAIITLKLALGTLRERGENLEPLLVDALEQAERANEELRELAHGILPTVLSHGGLRAGIRQLVQRLGIPARVAVPEARLAPELEASAYFIVAEALTNVVKHAGATRAEISVALGDDMLRVEVRDDGVGGADPCGHGLLGLRDRATALGGRLEVESPAGGGTVVAARLPLA
jgi:signal transduction histidine kinase